MGSITTWSFIVPKWNKISPCSVGLFVLQFGHENRITSKCVILLTQLFDANWNFLITLLYICYNELRNLISLKNNEFTITKIKCKVWQLFVYNFYHVHICKFCKLNSQCTEQYECLTFLADSWGSLIKPTFYV